MPSPQVTSVNWGDITTTTLEARSGNVADNVSNNNALYWQMKKKKQEFFDGGREIYQELRYAENQNFMWYSGTEPVNVTHNDTMTAARFPLKQASIAIMLSGLDQIQNSGDAAKMNLIEQRVDSAMATIQNQMSASIYSDGTGFGGKQIGGLGLIISKTPTTGIVGGIDRSLASNTWWRNIAFNANTDALGLVTQTNIVDYMAVFDKVQLTHLVHLYGRQLLALELGSPDPDPALVEVRLFGQIVAVKLAVAVHRPDDAGRRDGLGAALVLGVRVQMTHPLEGNQLVGRTAHHAEQIVDISGQPRPLDLAPGLISQVLAAACPSVAAVSVCLHVLLPAGTPATPDLVGPTWCTFYTYWAVNILTERQVEGQAFRDS